MQRQDSWLVDGHREAIHMACSRLVDWPETAFWDITPVKSRCRK